jgi:hypothetical protein
MTDSSDEKLITRSRPSRRHRPSLFGPIILIAIGAFFLLSNLDLLPGGSPNWIVLLQLWPLWLIFLGVNIIVRQAPGAIGSFLSALVALLAVAVFGYVLFFAEDSALLDRLRITPSLTVKTESIQYRADDVSAADIFIDFSSPGADLYTLDDSNNLIEGTVSYTGDLHFDASVSGGRADITLDTTSAESDGFFFLNPANWTSLTEEDRWQIGLAPDVETNLTLDVGSGSVDLNLKGLTLSELDSDGGSGRMELLLPDGDYNFVHHSGSGSSTITVAGRGRQTIEIDGGSGSITLHLPDSMEARVDVAAGSGSFNLNQDRFSQVRGDERDDGVWETAGYDDAPNRVTLVLDIGSGSVTIREP